MPTEADTCRTLITPKLQAAGWEDDPHCIAEQRTFTDGRIIVHGSTARRRPGKRADYILDYTGTATRNFADPAFDGDPAFATQEEIDEYGKVKETEVLTPEEPEDTAGVLGDSLSASTGERAGGEVSNSEISRSPESKILLRRWPGRNRGRTR